MEAFIEHATYILSFIKEVLVVFGYIAKAVLELIAAVGYCVRHILQWLGNLDIFAQSHTTEAAKDTAEGSGHNPIAVLFMWIILIGLIAVLHLKEKIEVGVPSGPVRPGTRQTRQVPPQRPNPGAAQGVTPPKGTITAQPQGPGQASTRSSQPSQGSTSWNELIDAILKEPMFGEMVVYHGCRDPQGAWDIFFNNRFKVRNRNNDPVDAVWFTSSFDYAARQAGPDGLVVKIFADHKVEFNNDKGHLTVHVPQGHREPYYRIKGLRMGALYDNKGNMVA